MERNEFCKGIYLDSKSERPVTQIWFLDGSYWKRECAGGHASLLFSCASCGLSILNCPGCGSSCALTPSIPLLSQHNRIFSYCLKEQIILHPLLQVKMATCISSGILDMQVKTIHCGRWNSRAEGAWAPDLALWMPQCLGVPLSCCPSC